MPSSQYFSQICAHGLPYMSGTSNSRTVPGATGVAKPSTGNIVWMHSVKTYGVPSAKPLVFTRWCTIRTGSTSDSGS